MRFQSFRAFRRWLTVVLAPSLGLVSGCGALPVDGGSDGDSNAPVVSLNVSNATPQFNDQVTLTCTIIAGDSAGAIYDFQPADGRLIVNRATGIALLIVSESDLGAALTYTCTATNADGTSRPSGEVIIMPTSGPAPDTMPKPTGASSGITDRH